MKYLQAILLLIFGTLIAHSTPIFNTECDEECVRISKKLLEQPNALNIVKFYLYNRNISYGSRGYSVYNVAALNTVFENFEPKNKTVIIIHGWMDNLYSEINSLLKEAYMKYNGYNVIITDWSAAGSTIPLYPVARSMVPVVANQLAMFIDILYTQYELKPENLHLIGHSLGAHIAGVAGKEITSGTIGRVTGLDPAGPLFYKDKPDERISNNSALFVDVIHTCGLLLGATYQMGHADFFPNNGAWAQPGCLADIEGICSHSRSYLYYAESIQYPFGYQSTPCSSWTKYTHNQCKDKETIVMGEETPSSARGSYYLRTNSEPPFFQL